MKTKTLTRITSLIIIGGLVLFGILYQSGYFSPQTPEPNVAASPSTETKPTSDALPAKAIRLKGAELTNRVQVTGTVLPNEEVALSSEIGGVITQINFQEGQAVGQGALMAKINDAELLAQRERLQAQVKLYENREFRQKKLLEKGGVSQDEYEGVLAELNSLKAQVKEIEAKISKTSILAPFSGVAGLRQISKGSYVNPGTEIVRLVNLAILKIEFSVPEKYTATLRTGQSIQVKNSSTEEIYEGKIYAIEPKIDLETRTITARARIQNPAGRLKPGAFVSIDILLDTYENALQIPSIALIQELEGKKVFVYQNGKSQAKTVKTGLRTEDKIQILEGLSAGDTVIITNLLNIRPNMDIQLQEIN